MGPTLVSNTLEVLGTPGISRDPVMARHTDTRPGVRRSLTSHGPPPASITPYISSLHPPRSLKRSSIDNCMIIGLGNYYHHSLVVPPPSSTSLPPPPLRTTSSRPFVPVVRPARLRSRLVIHQKPLHSQRRLSNNDIPQQLLGILLERASPSTRTVHPQFVCSSFPLSTAPALEPS
jgi:hypothetical protein